MNWCRKIFALSALLWLSACGASLDGVFKSAKKADVSNSEAKKPAPSEQEAPDQPEDSTPIAWPVGIIENAGEFQRGIPNDFVGEIVLRFQLEGVKLEDFDVLCRASPSELIAEVRMDECERFYEIDDYIPYTPYSFQLIAVHRETKQEKVIAETSFRTDPILILVPEEPALQTTFSGVHYFTLTLNIPQPAVYYTCSVTSDILFDATLNCGAGTLIIDFTRFNGMQRMRLMAWEVGTNRLLSERSMFFCSGFNCARSIGPLAPYPYGGP